MTQDEVEKYAEQHGFEEFTIEQKKGPTKGMQSVVWTAKWRGKRYGNRMDVYGSELKYARQQILINARLTMEALIERKAA